MFPHRRGASARIFPIVLPALLLIPAFTAGPLPASASESPNAVTLLAEHAGVRDDALVVQAGEVGYVFGGWRGGWTLSDEILRFDPADGSLTPVAARLPAPMHSMSGVWTGEAIYLFGGCFWVCGRTDQILKYDPLEDTITMMEGRLPVAVHQTSAVWTGEVAYVFGGATTGCGGWCGVNVIARYDPATDNATRMGATLPASAWWATSAVWDGARALIFGGHAYQGCVNCNRDRDTILSYDPATDTMSTLAHRLPSPRRGTTAAWDGEFAYVMGGGSAQIVRYDPATGASVVQHGALQGLVCCQDAFTLGGSVYVLTNDWTAMKLLVLRYDPSVDFPNTPPVPRIAAVPPHECVARGAEVALDATASSDADGDALSYTWWAWGGWGWPTVNGQTTPTPAGRFPFGTVNAQVTVSDGRVAASTSVPVTVVDTAAPSVEITRPTAPAYAFDETSEDLEPLAEALGSPVVVGQITIVAAPSDACGIASVAFASADGQSGVDTQAPYEFVLRAPAGQPIDQKVTVTARDLGGAEAIATIEFVHVGTLVADLSGAPWLSNPIHNTCEPAGAGAICESLIGPDPYPTW